MSQRASAPRFGLILWVAAVCITILACRESGESSDAAETRPAIAAAVTPTSRSQPAAQDSFRATLVADVAASNVGDAFPALDPANGALYFSQVIGNNWPHQRLVVARADGDGWAAPQDLPFSGDRQYSSRAPRLSPDGLRMVFTSNRPLPGREHDPADYNLWMVERSSPGRAWSDPEPLSDAVNSTASDIHASMLSDGSLYFASARPGGRGRSDIYRAARSGRGYAAAENIGAPINTDRSQPDLYVAADGSMMILVITDHPSGAGGDDLYVSHYRNGTWTEPRNLGPAVNTSEYEYGPNVSPNGEYLYFTSHRTGQGDVYRIALSDLDLGR